MNERGVRGAHAHMCGPPKANRFNPDRTSEAEESYGDRETERERERDNGERRRPEDTVTNTETTENVIDKETVGRGLWTEMEERGLLSPQSGKGEREEEEKGG